jgi:glutamine cyclotransferase
MGETKMGLARGAGPKGSSWVPRKGKRKDHSQSTRDTRTLFDGVEKSFQTRIFAGSGLLCGLQWAVVLLLVLPAAQAIGVAPKTVPEKKLELVRKIPFSGYSEGIDFAGSYLWSATPQQIRKINPATGEIMAFYPPATSYSESIVWWSDFLWTVSYADNGIYKAPLKGGKFAFSRVSTTPEVHAWGLAQDGKHLLMTGDHASNKIYFMNPKTLKIEKTLQVPVKDLEDLAWDGKGIWSSSFTEYKGKIFRINPKTGKLDGIFEIPEPEMCPIVDGIATQDNLLWITGKNCPSIYLVKNPLAG